MLDLKADTKSIEYLLRHGRSFRESQPRLELAKGLEKLGILKLTKFSIVKCSFEDDPDYDELSDEQVDCMGEITVKANIRDATCPKCRRRVDVRTKRTFTKYVILLNPSGTIMFVRKLFQRKSVSIRTRMPGLLEAQLNDESIKICFPEFCQSDLYLTWWEKFSDPIAYIITDTARVHKKDFSTDTAIASLGEILSSATNYLPALLEETLEISTDKKSKLTSFPILKEKFEKSLSEMEPSDFEVFIDKLLSEIQKRPERIATYVRKLQRRRSSILGAFVRRIGGTGAEDIMVEPKIEYLQNLFSSSGTHEMKKYKSTITLADLRELIEHCAQRATNGILFTNTHRVASSVWSRIRSVKLAHNGWKYTIVDRDLLFELLIELRLTSLF